MSATANSAPPHGSRLHHPPAGWRIGALWLLWMMGCTGTAFTGAAATNTPPPSERARIELVFTAARQAYLQSPTNDLRAWQFGRACFDRAEFATNNTERALLAEQGVTACRGAFARKPDSAPAHYYLAMNLGQLARTKTLGALRLVDEMEAEFKTARTLEEHFDFAGPDRNLGLLYLEAPGWPASIGSRSKARQHLRRAAELAPAYPENRLNLLEAYLRWGDRQGASRELREVETIWPVATTNLMGETWVAAWADWQARLNRAKKALGQEAKPPTAPRQRD